MGTILRFYRPFYAWNTVNCGFAMHNRATGKLRSTDSYLLFPREKVFDSVLWFFGLLSTQTVSNVSVACWPTVDQQLNMGAIVHYCQRVNQEICASTWYQRACLSHCSLFIFSWLFTPINVNYYWFLSFPCSGQKAQKGAQYLKEVITSGEISCSWIFYIISIVRDHLVRVL